MSNVQVMHVILWSWKFPIPTGLQLDCVGPCMVTFHLTCTLHLLMSHIKLTPVYPVKKCWIQWSFSLLLPVKCLCQGYFASPSMNIVCSLDVLLRTNESW